MNCFNFNCSFITPNLSHFRLFVTWKSTFHVSCLPPLNKKTVMSDEHIESLQISMQFLPTRLPKIVLQMVEEEFPTWREIIVSVMWPCADKRIISS
jgi:hypothetical protein